MNGNVQRAARAVSRAVEAFLVLILSPPGPSPIVPQNARARPSYAKGGDRDGHP